ncbi:hypothetical protein [Nitratireductor soli]|uniref:hypothetical protein n=1 Tax=Nitratireductor soli TaxID=1670619 RepID=UPI00065DBF0C|nr:hypothetical protein [Nitratireductor soli]
MTFDEAREKFPSLGLGLYGMEPGQAVTLEVYSPDGQVFSFRGATAQAALDLAFPPEPETPPAEPAENVFD